MVADPDILRAETERRRTFAIISHPDAGKTTLTEKLLLHGGAIHLAGAVHARGAQRKTTSDWMELEKQRGISVTSSVLQFTHRGHAINLLDTPGHQDFSEDTYRTLAAADAAVMLIDSAKGVEAQTKKLFQVCRRRGIPIFTFINKMDRAGRDPLELLHEVEEVLGIRTCPITWPLGSASEFNGVVDLFDELGPHGVRKADPLSLAPGETQASVEQAAKDHFDALNRGDKPPTKGSPGLRARALGEKHHARLVDEIGLLEMAGDPYDHARILKGELSPAFFGSAYTEVGVDEFLDAFVKLAPSPGPRTLSTEEKIEPTQPKFTGFVFKIQANMDPAHRDRLAFLRVCSGHFTRGMDARLCRTDTEPKPIRLAMPHQLFGQERVVIEEAWPGDVIGLFDTGTLRIGDTLVEAGMPSMEFAELPRFSPEIFARLRAKDALKRKQLETGLQQLGEEGVIQVFSQRGFGGKDPVLGAVGALQLEVLQYRLQHEYRAEVILERLPYQVARWVKGAGFDANAFEAETDCLCVEDRDAQPVALFKSEWNLNYAAGKHQDWQFLPAAPPIPPKVKKKA
ncbi:MAG: peptide chain release factor 3 [Deltaproteobacteria bacterium]|nr:peptide chain release factor 3 [Deltaproteobacteria bacterium]